MRKLDGAAQKVGRLCAHVHILSACVPFCQWISRSRQAEPRVFPIVHAPYFPNHHLRISWCDNCRLILTSPKTLQNPGTLKTMPRTPVTLKRWTCRQSTSKTQHPRYKSWLQQKKALLTGVSKTSCCVVNVIAELIFRRRGLPSSSSSVVCFGTLTKTKESASTVRLAPPQKGSKLRCFHQKFLGSSLDFWKLKAPVIGDDGVDGLCI